MYIAVLIALTLCYEILTTESVRMDSAGFSILLLCCNLVLVASGNKIVFEEDKEIGQNEVDHEKSILERGRSL